MQGRQRRAKIARVFAESTDRVTVEFEPGRPIHGLFIDQAGAAHAFRGWLELSAALEHAWQDAPANRERSREGGPSGPSP